MHALIIILYAYCTLHLSWGLVLIFTTLYLSDVCAFVAVCYLLLNDILCEGDVNSIIIGSSTNIQDNSLVHVAKSNLSGKVLPTIIGDNVTVGE